MTLDRHDRAILTLLQHQGRISNQELADQVGLSPSPCLRRVRSLEQNGIISGYLHQSELLVKEGDRVVAGQLIGRTGNTGMVTGPHLHIFLSIHGTKADPLSLLSLPIRARN